MWFRSVPACAGRSRAARTALAVVGVMVFGAVAVGCAPRCRYGRAADALMSIPRGTKELPPDCAAFAQRLSTLSREERDFLNRLWKTGQDATPYDPGGGTYKACNAALRQCAETYPADKADIYCTPDRFAPCNEIKDFQILRALVNASTSGGQVAAPQPATVTNNIVVQPAPAFQPMPGIPPATQILIVP
jgi:hypothetical protein